MGGHRAAMNAGSSCWYQLLGGHWKRLSQQIGIHHWHRPHTILVWMFCQSARASNGGKAVNENNLLHCLLPTRLIARGQWYYVSSDAYPPSTECCDKIKPAEKLKIICMMRETNSISYCNTHRNICTATLHTYNDRCRNKMQYCIRHVPDSLKISNKDLCMHFSPIFFSLLYSYNSCSLNKIKKCY